MSLATEHQQSSTYEAIRKAVYAGDLLRIPATPESLALVENAKQTLLQAFAEALGPLEDIQKIHEQCSPEHLYHVMMGVRKTISDPERSRHFISTLTQPFGLNLEGTVFDVMRLRWNAHQETFDEYAVHTMVHRDTWYANPQCQLNWWIPLFDVTEAQTFRFFTNYFNQPIENTSGHFDYEHWSREAGFQTQKHVYAHQYPTSTIRPDAANVTGISCRAGDILVFSGAHLHQTVHNQTGLTRFSIDFRTVDLEDKQQGVGAPNVDNASKGDTTAEYWPLASHVQIGSQV